MKERGKNIPFLLYPKLEAFRDEGRLLQTGISPGEVEYRKRYVFMPFQPDMPSPSQPVTLAVTLAVTLDPLLLALLCCPACGLRPALKITDGALVCAVCERTYAVKNGVPILLVEEQQPKSSVAL